MSMILPTIKANDKSFLELAVEFGDNPESLSEYAQVASVSPMVLLEDEIRRLPEDELNDLLQAHLTLYTGWYLLASTLKLNVDGVTVRDILNPLSTNPTIRNSISVSFESSKDTSKGLTLDCFTTENSKVSTSSDALNKPVNLMVGKVVDVPVRLSDESGGKTQTIPVNVRLNPRQADIGFMVELFKHINKDKGWIERYHQWRSGEIKSITDYVFALDVLREERRLAIKDKDGIYAEGKNRRAKGILSTIISGKRAINVASTITILTKRSASRLEAVLDGGRLSSYRTRQKFFEETGSMILTIVNTERSTLTVYTRGIEKEATWSFRDIKNMGTSPSAGFEISQVIASLSRGSLPGTR